MMAGEMITFACPACGHVHQRPYTAGGTKVRCENPNACPAKIRVPAVPPRDITAATPPPRLSNSVPPPAPGPKPPTRPNLSTLVRPGPATWTAPPLRPPDADPEFEPPAPDRAPPPGRAEWYYEHDDRPCGPVAADYLAELAEDWTVRPETLVWTAGAARWVPAGRVFPDLFPRGRRPRPPAWQRAVAAGLSLLAAVTALTFVVLAAKRGGPRPAPAVVPVLP